MFFCYYLLPKYFYSHITSHSLNTGLCRTSSLAARSRSQLLSLSRNTSTKLLVNSAEHLIYTLAGILLGSRQVTGDVTDEVILLAWLFTKNVPETLGLNVLLGGDLEQGRDGCASPLFVVIADLDRLVRQGTVRRWVSRVGTIVSVDRHCAITLIRVECSERSVDRNLLVVGPETVAVGIWVREKTRLKDRVGRWLNTWNQVGRGEGDLLDFSKVVLDILVKGEFSKWLQWDLLLWPDLGQIEDIPTELFSLLGREDLNVDRPGWVIALLDSLKKVLRVPVWVF
jgi:hypothetical protein